MRMKNNRIRLGISLMMILLGFLSSTPIHAQNVHLGSWNIVNLKYNFDKKWSVFGEAQLRSLHFYDDFHYYEYKGGVNWKVYPNLIFTLAGGSYQTYAEGGNFVVPKNSDEWRIWPQIIFYQSIGKLKVEQRYRAEFRFVSDEIRHRYRYRLGLAYPLLKRKKDFDPLQLSFSNELFFTDKEPYFQRNRLLFGLIIKTSLSSSWLLGYVHQFDYRINDETGRDFLQIGYAMELFAK